MSAGILFLVSQTVMGLPALPPGTEVRLVSPDLLTVYASAQVHDGALDFQVSPPAGTELRVLIFPPDATKAQRAAALSGARVISGRISVDGTDILLQFPNSDQPASLRTLLQERDISLTMMPGKEP
ncbi:MAG TPA: hypothetical protein VJ957_08610 [Longimicrobiales bacterium]|nr:hypothetical protein [Trueperaceae bacterium]HKJ93216.1 hypothetical protein [Longimicrobiales bacterium]